MPANQEDSELRPVEMLGRFLIQAGWSSSKDAWLITKRTAVQVRPLQPL